MSSMNNNTNMNNNTIRPKGSDRNPQSQFAYLNRDNQIEIVDSEVEVESPPYTSQSLRINQPRRQPHQMEQQVKAAPKKPTKDVKFYHFYTNEILKNNEQGLVNEGLLKDSDRPRPLEQTLDRYLVPLKKIVKTEKCQSITKENVPNRPEEKNLTCIIQIFQPFKGRIELSETQCMNCLLLRLNYQE